MKLLVPTDFSSCSINAINTALILAKRHKATIILLHVISDFFPWSEISTDDKPFNALQYAMSKLSQLESKVNTDGVSCRSIVREGSFIREIENQLEAEDYDLVLMGSHGVSGKEEWFIGSNAQKVIRKVHNKVMVIKNRPQDLSFDSAVYVTNLEEEGLNSFKQYIDFAKTLGTKQVHLLTVNSMGLVSKPIQELKKHLPEYEEIAADIKLSFHNKRDYSVDAGVRHFLSENDIDYVAISNHERHPVKRLFQGSNVEIIVNHTSKPILTIDYN